MATPVDFTTLTAISLDPQEAIEFFRSKGFSPPKSRFSYRDWWGASHARGFTVAKAMKDDLIATIRQAVEKAIAEGTTLEQFRIDLQKPLQQAGWWGRQPMTDPLTSQRRNVQLGSTRRLATIFDTNLRTSYNAGRWIRIQRTKEALPFLQYIQLQRVTKRASHAPFHLVIRPVDDEWWATHYPPNGYFCACSTRQISRSGMARRNLSVTPNPPRETQTYVDPRTGRRTEVPKGITPGFESNPGATFIATLGRHDRIAANLSPEARGVELGLILEARARGLRTGHEHAAALNTAAERPAPIGWKTLELSKSVDPDEGTKQAMADPARRIGLIHNHPNSSGFSKEDLIALDFDDWPGLDRLIAVGHDGSLYRASAPRPGLNRIVEPLYEYSQKLVDAAAADLGMNRDALYTLRGHATASALAQTGYIDYAHAIVGGSHVNLTRFGEDRMAKLIRQLVQWLNNRYPNPTTP